MPIEFRDVTLPPLQRFRAQAPAGVIIGLIGEQGSGIERLIKMASGTARPEEGDIEADNVIALDQPFAAMDAVARARALIDMDERRRAGATILLASHDISLLEVLSDEIWWLDGGRLAAKGDPKETAAKYRAHVAERVRCWGNNISQRLAPSFRRGDGRAKVLSLETLGADEKPTIVWKSGEMVSVRAVIRFREAANNPVFGLMIRTQIGFEVYGTNTELEHVNTGNCASGDTRTVVFAFRCDLCPRAYTLTLASHDADGTAHDWLDDAVAITVTDERYTAGVANLRAKVTVA
ncbi:MAG: Wzt carbohydrate-binding domain-containing protein [Bryobacterales bacterium]|nr:Wzt carbohydrate-binding domain-containing protein [Bryobacterales bacterium]MBV9398849.1 Wzt carbohydrate-binding domain-containing protein [Bryobacterales bacterium]